MVVDRGGAEDLFPFAEFLTCELNDHGEHLEDKNGTDERENQDLINHHGNHCEYSTKCQGTGIPHEEECRRHIVPEECRNRSYNHRAETSENVESLNPGENAKGDECNDEKPTRKSIQTICHIHCIRRTNENEHEERHIPEANL